MSCFPRTVRARYLTRSARRIRPQFGLFRCVTGISLLLCQFESEKGRIDPSLWSLNCSVAESGLPLSRDQSGVRFNQGAVDPARRVDATGLVLSQACQSRPGTNRSAAIHTITMAEVLGITVRLWRPDLTGTLPMHYKWERLLFGTHLQMRLARIRRCCRSVSTLCGF